MFLVINVINNVSGYVNIVQKSQPQVIPKVMVNDVPQLLRHTFRMAYYLTVLDGVRGQYQADWHQPKHRPGCYRFDVFLSYFPFFFCLVALFCY